MLIGVVEVAFSENANRDISFTLSSKVYSKYLSELGTGSVCHDKPVIQTDLLISLPKGFYLNIWHSAGLDEGLSSNYGNEINYTLGWSGKLRETKLSLGLSYFDCADLFIMPRGDLVFPYLEISKEIKVSKSHTLEPYVSFGFPFSAHSNEFGHAVFYRAGVYHFWQINEKFRLYNKANLFFDNGGLSGYDSGLLGQYRCDFSYQISKSITLDLISVKLNTPLSSLSDERNKTNISYGAGIKIRF